MLRAELIRYMIGLKPDVLGYIADQSGYLGDRYTQAEFLGITNGRQFCYAVEYVEDGETHKTKVFLTYNPEIDRVELEY